MSSHRLPKSPRALGELLEARGLRLTKDRGQNFLVDKNILDALSAAADAKEDQLILEIGPGAGALTEYLIESARLVVALDIDRGMIELLRDELPDKENLLLCEADVMGKHNALNPCLSSLLQSIIEGEEVDEDYPSLKIAKPAITPAAGFEGLRVIANLPYSITSPVIIALLESELPISDLTLLVQKEVAEKICADVGSKEWGLLSLLVRMHGDAEILRKVPKTVFWPMPKVDSAYIRITPDLDRDRLAIKAIKNCAAPIFRYRRKSLGAGIKHAHGIRGDEASALFDEANLSSGDHIEKLSIDDLKRLASAFHARGGGA